MKTPTEWLNEVGEVVMFSAFAGGNPPGKEVEALIKRIQDDATAQYASFPALVEALQDAITGIEHEQVVMQSFGGPTCSAIMLRALANARAALATALKASP